MQGRSVWLGAWVLACLGAAALGQQTDDALARWLGEQATRAPEPETWRERAQGRPELLGDVLRLSDEGAPAVRAGASNLLRALAEAEPEVLGQALARFTLQGDAHALARLDVIAAKRAAVAEFCRAALTAKADLRLRLAAARRLGEVQAQGAVRALEGLWREREHAAELRERRWIECVVIVALLRLGAETPAEPEPVLLAAAVGDDPALAAHGLEGLRLPGLTAARLRQPLAQAIQSGETVTRLRTIALCPRLAVDLTVELTDACEDTGQPLLIRQAAVRALGELGRERSARVLIALSGQGETAVSLRCEAVQALGKLPPTPAGREALERALLDDEGAIRRWALRGLTRYGSAESRLALSELVRQRPAVESAQEWQARAEAFTRVGVEDPDALAAMLRLTGEEPPAFLQQLLDFAATLKDVHAVPFLLEALGGPHETTRREAARQLRQRAGRVDHGLDRQAWRAWWEGQRR